MPQPYIDFAFVKEQASFEPILAHYNLQLVGRGKDRAVLCPFHRERKPSCKIELERRVFHCFGCEAKGNLLEFVARMERKPKDLRAAALKIADICKIAMAPPRDRAGEPAAPAPSKAKDRAPPGKPAAVNDNGRGERAPAGPEEPVNPPLTFTLKLDPEHPYLRERGLSAEQVADFGLGYCSRGLMGGRICIPIHDERGNLVAYAGRWPGEDVPEGEGKYKLPGKFEKSRVLFNLHRVAAGERLVLVEGYWSTIRLHALGVPVASPMGWSVSPEQTALLQDRGIRFLTLLLDGDDTGRRARERVLPDLASSFFVFAPLLPDGQKPDALPEAELLDLVSDRGDRA
jgi:DNA primase